MNQVTIKETEEFREIINIIEKSYHKIMDICDHQRKNAEEINETDTWTGEAARAMYEYYTILNSNYDHIEYSLDLYIQFMRKSLEDYIRLNEEFNRNIDDISESLDVNSNSGHFEYVDDKQ